MNSIQELLHETLNTYIQQKIDFKTARTTVPVYSVIVQKLPKLFREIANLSDQIKIQGSIGRGVITETPWICFFDTEITQSAQDGYYVCILFREDMKGFYLSLNQGWTQYKNSFGGKQGRVEIELNSKKATAVLRSAVAFTSGRLDLSATRSLGSGYELGNIYSRYYSAENLPDDKKLVQDLLQLLGAYRELKGIVGNNILNIRALSSEEDFQYEIQQAKKITIPNGPIKRPEQKIKTNSKAWPRDPRVSSTAIENAKYICEYDNSHNTFISNSSGHNYVEAHHLVPMEKQSDFNVSLDVPENIVALCPNCHRKIHHATSIEKTQMLEKLLINRKLSLKQRGISIGVTELGLIYEEEESLEQVS